MDHKRDVASHAVLRARVPDWLTHIDVLIMRSVCKRWRVAIDSVKTDASFPIRTIWLHENTKAGSTLTQMLDRVLFTANARTLNLEFAPSVNDKLLELCLGRFPQLTSVNVNADLGVTDSGVRTIVASDKCPRLTSLSLYTNVNITNKGAAYIAESEIASQLTALNLSGCKRIGDAGVCCIAENAPKLTSLDLTRIPLKDASLKAIGAHCGRLRIVRLYACGLFTDAGISALAAGSPLLEELDLCGTAPLTDVGLIAIAKHCPRLTYLNLTWCPHVTDVGLSALSALTRLDTLLVHGMTKITDAGFHALAKGCIRLKTMDVNGCNRVTLKSHDLHALFPSLQTLLTL